MSWFFRIGALVLTFTFLTVNPGCSASNEQEADIDGVAPEGGPTSQAEYGAQMKGAQGGTQDYPGAQ